MSSSKVAKHETSASSHVAAESDVELNLFVEEMIDQMENRFQLLGSTIMKRMEEMSVRMGDLEQSIANIMEQAGAVAESTTPSSVLATTAGGKDSASTGGTIQNNISNNKPKPATTMEI